jgi:hypothetical protein
VLRVLTSLAMSMKYSSHDGRIGFSFPDGFNADVFLWPKRNAGATILITILFGS